jgi:hypothetical protein
LFALFLGACSSSGDEAAATEAASNQLGSTQHPQAHGVCPSTVGQAVGAACDVEGELCYPEYACGIAPALATCTCHGGHFACVDQLKATLRPDAAAGGCPGPLPASACPASMTQANRTGCAQAGQICTYASPCSSIPDYLDCQCVQLTQIDGGVYLGYACDDPCTAGAGSMPVVDAGAVGSPDAKAGVPVDASKEASLDASNDGSADAGSADAGMDATHE